MQKRRKKGGLARPPFSLIASSLMFDRCTVSGTIFRTISVVSRTVPGTMSRTMPDTGTGSITGTGPYARRRTRSHACSRTGPHACSRTRPHASSQTCACPGTGATTGATGTTGTTGTTTPGHNQGIGSTAGFNLDIENSASRRVLLIIDFRITCVHTPSRRAGKTKCKHPGYNQNHIF